jgi:O-glycosyl hydrolase
MQSSGTQAADFLKVLYPTLQKANLTNVKLTCCDAMGYGTTGTMLGQLSSVTSMLGTITSHAYTGGPNTLNTKLPHWMTELADNNGAWTTAWYSNGGAGEGFTWANKIFDGLVNNNLAGYLYWIGAQERSSTTNSKLIDIRNGVVTPSKRLWAFAHFGRWVRPGAFRVQASGSGLKTSAYVNTDGRVAVQVINSGANAVSVAVQVTGMTVGGARAWVSDNSNDVKEFAVTLSGGVVSGNVPARSLVSFVLTA